MNKITIGFMPLTDCVPLVVALHYGFFDRHDLSVELVKQNSWATLRDKLHAGIIDAAHMLAPMPFASTLGLGINAEDIIAPMVLSRQGNGITVSNSLFAQLAPQYTKLPAALPLPASALKSLIANKAACGEKLTFATVFPYSCHFYQLRTWLAQYQIPISAINTVFIPPSLLVQAMQNNHIDGFCVGSPWNAHAVRSGVGVTGITANEIWPSMPEKVLGLKAAWYGQHPDVVHRLVQALREACQWLGHIPNRLEAARLLCLKDYLGAPLDVVAPSLLGSCLTSENQTPRSINNYNEFGAELGAQDNCPSMAQGGWILNQMLEAGHVQSNQVSEGLIQTVFREDIYTKATQ